MNTAGQKTNSRSAVILRNLNEYILKSGLPQRKLAILGGERGYSITQGAISKILTGAQRMTVENLEMFADILGISFEMLIRDAQKANGEKGPYIDLNLPDRRLLIDPEKESGAFAAYLGKFYIYFLSTSSVERARLMKGSVYFKSDEGYCSATLSVDIGDDVAPKVYKGQFLICRQMDVGYILWINPDTGELTFSCLRYKKFENKELLNRMGLILTPSAGDTHLPTLGLTLLSREEVDLQKYGAVLVEFLKFRTEEYVIDRDNGSLAAYVRPGEMADFVRNKQVSVIDRRKLMKSMLTDEKMERYLETVAFLREHAINIESHFQIDQELDDEMYEIARFTSRDTGEAASD